MNGGRSYPLLIKSNPRVRPGRRCTALCPLLAHGGQIESLPDCPLSGVKRTKSKQGAMSAFDPKRTKIGLKSRSAGGVGTAPPPRLRTIQFGPTKCVNSSTDLRCKSGIVCAGLVMPTVNLTRILSEAAGISSVGIRMSSVSTSVSSTIDPANVPTVGSIILCISM